MNSILRKIIGPGLSLILFTAAVWLLHNELRTYHLRDIRHAFDAIPGAFFFGIYDVPEMSMVGVTEQEFTKKTLMKPEQHTCGRRPEDKLWGLRMECSRRYSVRKING